MLISLPGPFHNAMATKTGNGQLSYDESRSVEKLRLSIFVAFLSRSRPEQLALEFPSQLIFALEVIHRLAHSHPCNAFMFVDMLDEPLMHQKRMRPSGNVGLDGHGEYEFVVLAVKVIKMVPFSTLARSPGDRMWKAHPPNVFNIPRIHKTMTIWHSLHEHHGW
jgi:hypothetical protein